MSKHTPGSWYARDDGYIMSSGTDEFGGVVGYFNATDEDLKLAAAAPDLLKALEQALNALAHCKADAGYNSTQNRAAHAASKAIARAKGESS